MSISKNNDVIHGMSGKFGDMIVFRQRSGKTIGARAPGEINAPASAKQQAVRERFQRAILYGKTVIADPLSKEAYAAKAAEGISAFNVAVADFFQAPDILEVNLTGYFGQPGQRIHIKVTDDFEVTGVTVQIHNADGSLQEEGDAAPDATMTNWTYTASTVNTSLTGDKITVSAFDNPNNVTKDERTLP
jgi:hypothetical protein